MKLTTTRIARAAVIAALYATLCIFMKPLSYGPIQLRISEVLCVLPIFMPEAIIGLFIGCITANFLGGASVVIVDATLGSLTTLVAAYLTRIIYKKTKNLFLSLLPPVVLNALIVGTYIPLIYTSSSETSMQIQILISICSVFIGQAIVIFALGIPFAKALKKVNF